MIGATFAAKHRAASAVDAAPSACAAARLVRLPSGSPRALGGQRGAGALGGLAPLLLGGHGVDAQHERIDVGAEPGHRERHPLHRRPGDEARIARQAVELRGQHRAAQPPPPNAWSPRRSRDDERGCGSGGSGVFRPGKPPRRVASGRAGKVRGRTAMRPSAASTVLIASMTLLAAASAGSAQAQRAGTPGDGARERPAARPDGGAGDAAPTPAVGPTRLSEDQARNRLREAGYTAITGLRLDDLGAWRGRADRNGSAVDVAVDREGKVIGGSGAEH
jgi:hypothetical protein